MTVGIILALVWVYLVYRKLRAFLDYCSSTQAKQRVSIDEAHAAAVTWKDQDREHSDADIPEAQVPAEIEIV